MESEQTIIEPEQTKEVISTTDWIIILLISSIPILNIIMFFVWAFGEKTSKTKANWAKAMLVWTLLTMLLMFLYTMFCAVMFASEI